MLSDGLTINRRRVVILEFSDLLCKILDMKKVHPRNYIYNETSQGFYREERDGKAFKT